MHPILYKCVLTLFSWRIKTVAPDLDKYILVAAPHTTNWDFPLMILTAKILNIKFYWMGKKSLFNWPFKRFMEMMGGIPIDRSKSNQTVSHFSTLIKNASKFVLLIPPEGTRSKTDHWKSGFIHIAKAADVKIVFSYMDYKVKEIGFSSPISSAEHTEKIMTYAKAFYKDVKPLYPERFGPIRLKEDNDH
ncbi:MAG: hypothetical protein CBC42_07705 [Betaproteobacteria bacterium TMED82]|nr:MAG: hypothetical protein CBC42_07705 [Betaproteobacteria bacterium TMED82]|tara:strand:- start:894 stop:1463 length:570 start_codon:yes stop_codon:yes gene_type:complete